MTEQFYDTANNQIKTVEIIHPRFMFAKARTFGLVIAMTAVTLPVAYASNSSSIDCLIKSADQSISMQDAQKICRIAADAMGHSLATVERSHSKNATPVTNAENKIELYFTGDYAVSVRLMKNGRTTDQFSIDVVDAPLRDILPTMLKQELMRRSAL